MSFSVLYVCTGNICRSPMASRLFEAWADPSADVVVDSCGIDALVGIGIDDSTAAAMARMGVDPVDHKGKLYSDELAMDSDLILCAARYHRDYVVKRLPQVHRRTFTMKEFVRLAAQVPVGGDPRTTVAATAARRGVADVIEPVLDDVADPFQGSMILATSIAEDVRATVIGTLNTLGYAKRSAPVAQ